MVVYAGLRTLSVPALDRIALGNERAIWHIGGSVHLLTSRQADSYRNA